MSRDRPRAIVPSARAFPFARKLLVSWCVLVALLPAAASLARPKPPPPCGGPLARRCELQEARAERLAQLDAELQAAGGDLAPADRAVARLLTERAVILSQYLSWGTSATWRRVNRTADEQTANSSARRAVAILRRLDAGRATPDLACALAAQGIAGPWEGSTRADSLRESVALWTAIHGGDHPDMLPALEALCESLMTSSGWDELAALLARADRCQQAYPDPDPERAAWRAWRQFCLEARNGPGIPSGAWERFAPFSLPMARAISIGHPRAKAVWGTIMFGYWSVPRGDELVAVTELFLAQLENGGLHLDGETIIAAILARDMLVREGRPELETLRPRLQRFIPPGS